MNAACANFLLIEKAIHYLHREFPRQVSLEELAAHVHLSPFHFQRVFKEWAGVSPKRYLQFLTLRYAKSKIAHSGSLLEASEAAGLSGSGRLHDLFVKLEGVTPGEFKAQGVNLEIKFGVHETHFGKVLIAATVRGICKIAFTEAPELHLAELKQEWPKATITKNNTYTAPFLELIFTSSSPPDQLQKLLVKGTPFQLKVWEALLQIPEGELKTYGMIADAIGMPKAVRAVGTAIGQNPVAYLIPCHRVIRKSGQWGDYRWGLPRKLALIGWEASRHINEPNEFQLV